ncbi:MAG TPA: hypothetical protein VMZ29_08765, partial [Candidatus Bathyarchaeia archaeon]|nr:hypothetical protein [Candidatus Bathyarchaeia archaeon]
MRKIVRTGVKIILVVTILILANFSGIGWSTKEETKTTTPTREEIAYYWAPVWYQDIDNSCCVADYITNFDFDGNWIGSDNWENLEANESYSYKACIYYSIVETATHWFIGYYDYHARDWTEIIVLQHEHDFEGVLVVVKKGPTEWGEFICMITESHGHLYQYIDKDSTPSMFVRNNYDDIDGDVEFSFVDTYNIPFPFVGHNHPMAYVDCWGHGVHGDKRWAVEGFPGGDGVIYKPKGTSEEPNKTNYHEVSYSLVNVDIFWAMRSGPYGENCTMGSFSAFDGDTFGEDSALLPWGWDDPDDGPTFAGEIFYDPANLVSTQLKGLGEFSYNYTYNPYALEITIDRYRVNWDLDSGEDNSDGYLNLYLISGVGEKTEDDGVLDGDSGIQYSWIGWDMEPNKWVDMHKEITRPFYGLH